MHPDAGAAARATQAAGRQGKAWELADKMFANYRQLKRDNIEGYAGEVGLDLERFIADLDGDAVEREVAADLKAGRDAGVRGTPTIFVNGIRFSGPRTLDGFRPVIDQEIKKAGELLDKGMPIEKIYETLAKRQQAAG